MTDPIAACVAREQPATLGERLACALVAMAPPAERHRGQPWTNGGVLRRATGLHQEQIRAYVLDRCRPNLATVEKLARALGVRAAWLAWGEPPIRSRR